VRLNRGREIKVYIRVLGDAAIRHLGGGGSKVKASGQTLLGITRGDYAKQGYPSRNRGVIRGDIESHEKKKRERSKNGRVQEV